MSSPQHRNTERLLKHSPHLPLIVFHSLTDSWIWGLQEWHGIRVWRVRSIRGWLWLCRAGQSTDVAWRGKSQSELIHQVSGCVFNCLCQLISNNPHLFICLPPQASLRAEKGQKGEPAIIEPVSCWRHLMNSLVALVMSMRIAWCSPNVHSILSVLVSRAH